MTQTTYDIHQHYWLKKSKISPRFLELIIPSLQHTDTVVDIGCGNGRLAGALRPFVSKCVGIDYSHSLVAKAQAKHCLVNFEHGDVCDKRTWHGLPKFDVAVSNVAIRRDGCALDKLLPYIKHCRQLFFKIQLQGDMLDWANTSPLYHPTEIGYYLEPYFDLEIEIESYTQGFSDADYFRLFLQRINLIPNNAQLDTAPAGRLYIPRTYALVSARRSGERR